jgi:gluconokinase
MAANVALNDADREPWLQRLALEVTRGESAGGVVLACSALKRSYRDRLFACVQAGYTVYLEVERAELVRRLEARRGQHEFIAAFDRLLDEQLRDLEPPADAFVVRGGVDQDDAVARLAQILEDRKLTATC